MNHKKLSMIAVGVVLIVLVAGIGIWLSSSDTRTNRSVTNSDGSEIISGKVTEISNACTYDATCSVTLDGKKRIITGCGLSAEGRTCAYYDQSKLHVGQKVEATVVKGASGDYGLDCDSCTIRVDE